MVFYKISGSIPVSAIPQFEKIAIKLKSSFSVENIPGEEPLFNAPEQPAPQEQPQQNYVTQQPVNPEVLQHYAAPQPMQSAPPVPAEPLEPMPAPLPWENAPVQPGPSLMPNAQPNWGSPLLVTADQVGGPPVAPPPIPQQAPVETGPTYSLEAIQKECARMVKSSKAPGETQHKIACVLADHGVSNATQLQPHQFDNVVACLRTELGKECKL